MSGTKSWWRSRGVVGPVFAIVIVAANHFFGLTPEDVEDWVNLIAVVFGGGTGVVGRVRATERIK